jgi:hypothetical protein
LSESGELENWGIGELGDWENNYLPTSLSPYIPIPPPINKSAYPNSIGVGSAHQKITWTKSYQIWLNNHAIYKLNRRKLGDKYKTGL